MKRGKEEEKIVGPMFPRLHVNDTEKGGPRAPPRNKMALYEQFSIPSQRFNPGVLPPNPNNPTSLVPPESSSQGNVHERGMLFQLHIPSSTHPAEKMQAQHSDLNTPLAQLEHKKKLDEEDFRVPIFVHSGMGQDHSKNNNIMDKERHSPFSPSCAGRLMKFQNASDKEPKQTSTTGLNLRQEGRTLSEENSKEIVAGREQSVKSASNLLAREKTDGLLKKTNACSNEEHRDHPTNNFSRLQNTAASLQEEYRVGSQPDNTARGDGVSNEPLRGIENENYSISRRDFDQEEQRSPEDPLNDNENCEEKTSGSLRTGILDRGDDVSETTMVDSTAGLDVSPDDVVRIIGQKHFWKARRAIVNQQRVFAVQVFELHRLIKVQRLIAGSPHLLLEDNAYLGKPLKGAPGKKLSLDYIVKSPPHIVNHKGDSEKSNYKMEPRHIVNHKGHSEKSNYKMECSENAVGKTSLAEDAVGKTSFSSVQNCSQPSNFRPFSGNSTPASSATKMGPWCFQQPSGHQWLIPVMSPSEGLIYKPYPGPEFMGPVCGGFGPSGSTPANFFNPAYGVPTSHNHYQGIGVPSVGHGYFPPYAMPVMNTANNLGSAVEQMSRFAGPGSHGNPGQVSGGAANFNMQHQSSCNVTSQKNEDISKLHASKDSELQGSTASSPSDRQEGIGAGQTIEGRNALPLFPTYPAHVTKEASQPLFPKYTSQPLFPKETSQPIFPTYPSQRLFPTYPASTASQPLFSTHPASTYPAHVPKETSQPHDTDPQTRVIHKEASQPHDTEPQTRVISKEASQPHDTYPQTRVIPLFPTYPADPAAHVTKVASQTHVATHVTKVVSQTHDTDQPTRVIKVVPHNARSATESVARIFQSIQEERKQYDSV